MKAAKLFLISAIVLGSAHGIAATQGTLGATSTGSFTNTFDETYPRQVQVLGLQDALVNQQSSKLEFLGGQIFGATDNFCVVDTSGGAVRLTFTFGTAQTDGWGNAYAHAPDGSSKVYALQVKNINESTFSVIHQWQSNYDVPAGTTFTAASNCGSGNMVKQVGMDFLQSYSNQVYSDTVTVLATPL